MGQAGREGERMKMEGMESEGEDVRRNRISCLPVRLAWE